MKKDDKKQATKYDYAKAMKDMGIDTSKYKTYEGAEKFARHFSKVSIQKHTMIALSDSTAGMYY